jgi:hypothetical protein
MRPFGPGNSTASTTAGRGGNALVGETTVLSVPEPDRRSQPLGFVDWRPQTKLTALALALSPRLAASVRIRLRSDCCLLPYVEVGEGGTPVPQDGLLDVLCRQDSDRVSAPLQVGARLTDGAGSVRAPVVVVDKPESGLIRGTLLLQNLMTASIRNSER